MSRDIRNGQLIEPDEAVVEFERLPQVVKRLSARARRHIANSVSKNTIRGMRADLRVYQRAGGLLPADEFDIANFIADQRALGKKPATLERYLNSLHMWHRYMNLPSPVRSMPVRAVMRSISLGGKLGAGRLGGNVFYQRLQIHLAAAGMADRGFSPHSFRAGFITEAHRQGKPDVAIKRISGHRDQRTFERYIRRTDEFEDHAGDFYPGVEEARV